MWPLISGLGQSINLMTIFYNYLIASHPTIVLCMYLFVYCCFAKYIFDLGGLLCNAAEHHLDGVDFDPSYAPKEKEKVQGVQGGPTHTIRPQTKKTTPIRYQKGKYRNMEQGVRRTLSVHRKGKSPRPRLRKRYARNKGTKEGEKKWASEHVWAPLLEPSYSAFFDRSCDL